MKKRYKNNVEIILQISYCNKIVLQAQYTVAKTDLPNGVHH